VFVWLRVLGAAKRPEGSRAVAPAAALLRLAGGAHEGATVPLRVMRGGGPLVAEVVIVVRNRNWSATGIGCKSYIYHGVVIQ